MQESNVDAHLFHLKVVSVNGVFYDGKCRAVVLPSIDGEMAFLAHHEEMFLAIYDGQIRIQKEDGSSIEAIVSLGDAPFLLTPASCLKKSIRGEQQKPSSLHRNTCVRNSPYVSIKCHRQQWQEL